MNCPTSWKRRLETCLNGKTAQTKRLSNRLLTKNNVKSNVEFQNGVDPIEHNSVQNQIVPRKQPGLYMIHCFHNDWRYYGQSSNVSGLLASHKSLLTRKIHPNKYLQLHWNFYGEQLFKFTVIYMGEHWTEKWIRRGKQTEWIVLDRHICYNILIDGAKSGEKNPFWKHIHTPQTKKK